MFSEDFGNFKLITENFEEFLACKNVQKFTGAHCFEPKIEIKDIFPYVSQKKEFEEKSDSQLFDINFLTKIKIPVKKSQEERKKNFVKIKIILENGLMINNFNL